MEKQQITEEALLEISIGRKEVIKILVDSIYDGSIDIVEATKAAKEICYSFAECMAIIVIADAFKDLEVVKNESKD